MQKNLRWWQKSSADEQIVLLLVSSIFLSLYACILIMLTLFVYLIKQKRLPAIMAGAKKVVFLAIFLLFSLYVAFINRNYLGVLMGIAICVMMVIGIYLQAVMSQRLFHKIVFVAAAGSILNFAIAILQEIFCRGDNSYRASALFINPNYYAMIIEFVVLLCVYALIQKKVQPFKTFYIITITLNIVGLYLCGCRTAFLALGIAVIILLFLSKKYKVLFFCSIAICSFMILFFLFPNAFRLNSIGVDFGTRKNIWRMALTQIKGSLFTGKGTMAYLHTTRHFSTAIKAPHAHNIVLDVLINYGILGTILLLIPMYYTIKPIVQNICTNKDSTMPAMLIGIIITIFIHGLLDVTIFFPQTGLLFLAIWSVTGIYAKKSKRNIRFTTPAEVTPYAISAPK